MDETLEGFVDLFEHVGVVFEEKEAAGVSASTWQDVVCCQAAMERT